jgi:hypothetical protein
VKAKPAIYWTNSDPMTPPKASFAMQKIGINRLTCRLGIITLRRLQLTRVRVDKMGF